MFISCVLHLIKLSLRPTFLDRIDSIRMFDLLYFIVAILLADQTYIYHSLDKHFDVKVHEALSVLEHGQMLQLNSSIECLLHYLVLLAFNQLNYKLFVVVPIVLEVFL